MVAALDNERAGTTAALVNRELAAAAVAESARRGYLDGRALEGVFTWLRPNDLVWSYVVNNYLLGKEPPAFDVLYWNQDTVRLAAGLHRDFIKNGLENALAHPGALEVLGSPVDLGASTSTATSSPVSPTTSSRGRTRTAARSCSAATRGSCSRRPDTSRRSSTRLAGQPLELPDRRRPPGRARGVARPGRDAARQLVARLRPMAGRPLGRARARPQDHQARGQGPGELRPCPLKPCPTPTSATRSPRTTSASASSSRPSSGSTSSPPAGSSTRRSCRSSTTTGSRPSCPGR